MPKAGAAFNGGSNVTVLDLSETQLERDRLAASHYGHSIVTEQGDMRDLSGPGGRGGVRLLGSLRRDEAEGRSEAHHDGVHPTTWE